MVTIRMNYFQSCVALSNLRTENKLGKKEEQVFHKMKERKESKEKENTKLLKCVITREPGISTNTTNETQK